LPLRITTSSPSSTAFRRRERWVLAWCTVKAFTDLA